MAGIQQNTLHLATPGSYAARDHLTLQIEVPDYPPTLAPEDRNPKAAIGWRKLSVPIHLLESICVFGPGTISPPALDLCWEHGVAVNFLNESGYLQARMTGVADTSVTLRRTHFRAADDAKKCAAISRQIVAGKIQNSRNSLLRARELPDAGCTAVAPRVAVVGAGMAGLNAAYKLQQVGLRAADLRGLRAASGWPDVYRQEPAGRRPDHRARGRIHRQHPRGDAGAHQRVRPGATRHPGAGAAKLKPETYFINGRHYTQEEAARVFVPIAKRILADYDALGDVVDYRTEGGGSAT